LLPPANSHFCPGVASESSLLEDEEIGSVQTAPWACDQAPTPHYGNAAASYGWPQAYRELLMPRAYASIKGFDRWVIEHVFPGLKRGYFIEAGAVDGVAVSNTLHLEKLYGWTGLLVEGREEEMKILRETRPKSHVRMAVLAAEEGVAFDEVL